MDGSEAKLIEKALEFTAKLRFRASRNAVVAPEMLGKQTHKSVPTATLLENVKMSILAVF